MNSKPTYKELEEELAFLKTTNKLIEKSPIVRFIWKNQENWPVEFVSENVKNIFGYSADDFIKNKIIYTEIILPDDVPRVENEVSSHSKPGFHSIEHEPYRIISKSGDIKWLNDITLIKRNKNNEITHYEGIIIDITEQKETEQALKESENKFSKTFYSDVALMAISTIKDGKLINVNQMFLDTMKLKKEEVIGKTSTEINIWSNASQRDEVSKIIRKKGSVQNVDVDILTKNGEIRHGIFSAHTITINGEDCMFSIFNDITDRKKTEQSLKESEDRLSKTLIAANDGMWDWNLITDEVYLDPQYYKMAGYEVNEFPQEIKEFQKRIHPNDVENVMAQVQQHLEGKTTRFDIEFRFKKKSGDWLWMMGRGLIVERDKNDKPLRFIGTHTDITERKKAEDALKASEEKFHTIADFANDWEYWTNPQGGFIHTSPSCEHITGYSPNEFIQNPELLTSIVHPDDVNNWKNHKHNVCDITEIETIEFRIITKSGEERWIGHICQTIYNDNGVNIGIRGSNRDITENKLVELALQESEELMSLFMDSATDNFTLWSSSLHLLKINRMALSLLPKGTKSEDLIGKSLREISSNIEKTGREDKYLKVIETGEPFFSEDILPHPRFGDIHLSVRAFKVGEGLGVMAENITERKKAQQALKESKQKFESMILNSPDLIMSQNTVGKLKYISPQCEDILGYTAEEIKNIDISKLIHPNDIEKTAKTESTTLGGVEINNFEYRFLKKNGDYVWLNHTARPIIVDGKITEILSTVRDITGRKKIEQDLKEQSIFINTLLENLKIGVVACDSKGDLTYFNQTTQEFHGLPQEKIPANQWANYYDLFFADGKTKMQRKDIPLFRALEGEQFNDIEMMIIPKHRDPIHIAASGAPIYDFNKNKLGAVVAMYDITDRKKSILTLKESEQKLKIANATKDKFFSIIAHDLRSPFNSMLGFSEILNNDFDKYDSEKQKRFISLIHAGINRTYKLLDNLLLWSSSQRGVIVFNPEEINLYLLFVETIKLLNQSADDKSIKLLNQTPEDVCIIADKQMLSTIIRNLLSNAIKYTHKGGEINLSARLISDKNNHTAAEITISDNGVGIPSKIQSKLFDVGQDISTKGTDNETGTGLGLVLCKDFVEKHGGKIWVESETENRPAGKAGGTTFYFTIPNK